MEACTGMDSRVAVATCQFPVSPWLRQNAHIIRQQMGTAAAAGADVVHFCETALSGYASKEIHTWEGYDWRQLRQETEAIMAEARRLKIWVVLGSTHPLSNGRLPHDSVYVITPDGSLAGRYDKRFCTRPDLDYYSCGDHYTIFEIKGLRCGVLICYDVRFPELYRDYCRQGVKLMFHSFYNARAQGPGILTTVMRATLQGHAATNGMWLSAANSSSPYQLWPSVMVRPDGLIAGSLRQHRRGIMIHQVDPNEWFYDASAPFRAQALAGTLSSEPPSSEDARSRNHFAL